MKIGLIGYGRMGREVEHVVLESGHEIGWIYDAYSDIYAEKPDASLCNATDCAIAFTSPAGLMDSVQLAAKSGMSIVIGTTGWYDELDDVKKIIEESSIGLLYAQNFSIGVHMFMQIVRNAAKLVNAFDEYDISIHERHHNRKADAPSGTALKLAEDVVANIERKKIIYTENPNKTPEAHELYVSSERTGHVPGTHSVLIDGRVDSIELTHTARSRQGFALGAVRAAEWLQGKQGLYTIEDMIHEINIA